MATRSVKWTMSAETEKKAASAQTRIAQCAAVTVRAHCAKTTTSTRHGHTDYAEFRRLPLPVIRCRARTWEQNTPSFQRKPGVGVEMGGIEPEWRNCNEKRGYAPFCATPASLVVTHAHMQTMERYSHLTEHLPHFLDGRTTVFSSLVLCGASAL